MKPTDKNTIEVEFANTLEVQVIVGTVTDPPTKQAAMNLISTIKRALDAANVPASADVRYMLVDPDSEALDG